MGGCVCVKCMMHFELVIVCRGKWVISDGVCIAQHVGSECRGECVLIDDGRLVGVVHSV